MAPEGVDGLKGIGDVLNLPPQAAHHGRNLLKVPGDAEETEVDGKKEQEGQHHPAPGHRQSLPGGLEQSPVLPDAAHHHQAVGQAPAKGIDLAGGVAVGPQMLALEKAPGHHAPGEQDVVAVPSHENMSPGVRHQAPVLRLHLKVQGGKDPVGDESPENPVVAVGEREGKEYGAIFCQIGRHVPPGIEQGERHRQPLQLGPQKDFKDLSSLSRRANPQKGQLLRQEVPDHLDFQGIPGRDPREDHLLQLEREGQLPRQEGRLAPQIFLPLV